jgi:class 3 adenylate cyclase
MSASDPRFDALREAGVSDDVVQKLTAFLLDAPEHELGRINALDFAATNHLDDEVALDAMIRASRLGLLEMSWNLLCPGCGGVLGANANLKSITRTHYNCSLCAARYELTLDELVEVNFCVSPQLRRVAAHEPERLTASQFYRQMYFSPSLVMPVGAEWDRLMPRITLFTGEVDPGTSRTIDLDLPREFLIVFEPITHAAVFMAVSGEPVEQAQQATVVFTAAGPSPARVDGMRPGPIALTLDNKTATRALPGVFIANDEFHHLLAKRQFVTGKRLLTNQTFRDLYRTETIDVEQRLKIANLTMLFTDLKGSTELYERVGDLQAFELVRNHFRVLSDVVRRHGGAVVKTIGDAVMATFPLAQQGVLAALDMRSDIENLNAEGKHEDLVVKIGLHQGPCLAVVSNERLDYFGQTVNVAARVQGLAEGHAIFATAPIVTDEAVAHTLTARNLVAHPRRAMLKGIREELVVYEIP